VGLPGEARAARGEARLTRAMLARWRGVALYLAAVTGLVLAVAFWGLERFPNSGDEYSYLLQARLFAAGRLSFPSTPESVRPAFKLYHVIDDGRVRSKYPPGWPLLLAAGEALGLAWIVNPLLSAATLALLFGTLARAASRGAAWTAMLVLGLSPFFVLNAASYFSHQPLLLAATAVAYTLVRSAESRSPVWPCLCGAALAWGLGIRPLEAAICGLAVLACVPRLGWRRSAWIAAGGLPGVALHALYNQLQFGSPLETGYALYARLSSGTMQDFGASVFRGWRVRIGWLVSFAAWTVPGAFALAPLAGDPTADVPARRLLHRYLVALAVIQLAAVPLYAPYLGDAYGPRFVHLLLLPLAGLAGLAIEALAGIRAPRRALAAAAAVPLVLALAVTAREALRAHGTIAYRSTIYRIAEGARLDGAVVLLESSDDHAPYWYTRNGIDFRGPVVYARGDVGLEAELRAFFPDRRFYRYALDAGHRRRVLVELPDGQGR
jgi:hypothetical protein